ncbi:MAG: metallophosphatase family protein, partial [Candidatus Eremiobacteraeota bacterium]|nr:metallophosphatase family protein [Candidatus Eremiobacteraeota bacterium]
QILHLGDFTAPEVADWFAQVAPFDAVAGNNDSPELWKRFGRKKILTCAGARLGLIHGDGDMKTTLQRAIDAFDRDGVDAILFGHSHNPYCAQHGTALVFNPGSPTDKRHNAEYSYGILKIAAGAITPSLHYYAARG